VTVDGSIVAKTNVGNAPKREGFLTHELESVASARHRSSQKSLLDTALLSYRSRVSTPSAPGKRGNQRSGVLGLDLSGLPTNQALGLFPSFRNSTAILLTDCGMHGCSTCL
jgi:hypothetical protein